MSWVNKNMYRRILLEVLITSYWTSGYTELRMVSRTSQPKNLSKFSIRQNCHSWTTGAAMKKFSKNCRNEPNPPSIWTCLAQTNGSLSNSLALTLLKQHSWIVLRYLVDEWKVSGLTSTFLAYFFYLRQLWSQEIFLIERFLSDLIIILKLLQYFQRAESTEWLLCKLELEFPSNMELKCDCCENSKNAPCFSIRWILRKLEFSQRVISDTSKCMCLLWITKDLNVPLVDPRASITCQNCLVVHRV